MHGVQPTAKAAPTSPAPDQGGGPPRRSRAAARSASGRAAGSATMAMPIAISRQPGDQVEHVLVPRERVADQPGAGAVGREHQREAQHERHGRRPSRRACARRARRTTRPEMNEGSRAPGPARTARRTTRSRPRRPPDSSGPRCPASARWYPEPPGSPVSIRRCGTPPSSRPSAVAQAEAADALGLHDDLRLLLASPHREITAQVPVRMDDGRLRVLTAHRVQHNGARGPYKGGLRPTDPGASRPESGRRAHAAPMTWKTALVDLPFGAREGRDRRRQPPAAGRGRRASVAVRVRYRAQPAAQRARPAARSMATRMRERARSAGPRRTAPATVGRRGRQPRAG